MSAKDFDDFFATAELEMPRLPVAPLTHALSLPRPDGMIVECGVFEGRTITEIALAAAPAPVYGFDSFEGLPEDWGRPDMAFPKGWFARSTLPVVPPNVTLVKGWFDDTLPQFAAEHAGTPLSLLHIDCDLYSSTNTVLHTLHPMFRDGTIIVFDELFNYPTYEKHELKALHEYLRAHPEWDVEWIGCRGPLLRHPLRDNGAWDQPAALRLHQKSRRRGPGEP